MKKILLSIFVFLIAMGSSIANPIYLPYVLFSEISWDEDDEWIVELRLDELYFTEGNPVKMKSSHGEAFLKQDLIFPANGIFLITADSLEQPLEVDRQGDYVEFLFQELPGEWTSDYGMHCFGDYPGAEVSVVQSGQSIVQYINYEYDVHYLVKESSPTLGYDLNSVSDCYGSLEGFVYDVDGYPVQNANLKEFRFLMYTFDLVTDENGAFNAMDVMPKIYDVIVSEGNCIIHDTLALSIEPDSTTFIEITADTCIPFQAEDELVVEETNNLVIKVVPNPFDSEVSVVINASRPLKLQDGFLRLFNMQGEEIWAKPLNTPYITNLNLSLGSGLAELARGVYVLSIENSGKVLATQKIIRE